LLSKDAEDITSACLSSAAELQHCCRVPMTKITTDSILAWSVVAELSLFDQGRIQTGATGGHVPPFKISGWQNAEVSFVSLAG